MSRYSRKDGDFSILANMERSDIAIQMKGEYAQGLMEMFIANSPWQTFGTLTIRPDYGDRVNLEQQSGVSSGAMHRIMKKMFSRRPLRSLKYFWALERHKPEMLGGKGGCHAHFLTKDEPKDLRWTDVWKWWFETKGYGRFATSKINYEVFEKMSAYLAKYTTKDTLQSDWGFARFGPRPTLLLEPVRESGKPSVTKNSDHYQKLVRETMDWGRKAHAGTRAVYRRPVLDRPVKWSQIESSGH